MNAYYKGQPVLGSRGPAGPDGSPIGTIISFMGTTAPKDYLICDGAEYPVSEYPDLADFFRQQFGSASHFGGDGETTFAVPDMRNLFLRGYHGEAEEQLSGDIGELQEATKIPNIKVNSNKNMGGYPSGADTPMLVDSYTGAQSAHKYGALQSQNAADIARAYFTARPVNMAVLYCIKAVESLPAENVYSTEESRVGTWVDGKPLYRKVFVVKSSSTSGATAEIANVTNLDARYFSKISGMLKSVSGNYNPINSYESSLDYIKVFVRSNGNLCERHGSEMYNDCPMTICVEYTKNAD